MPVQKRYLKNNNVCKVTFRVSPEIGKNYKKACVIGSFNNWNYNSHRMKKLVKDGSFSIIVNLDANKEYEFKYLLDDKVWLNDEEADGQVFSQFGNSQNSVIKL